MTAQLAAQCSPLVGVAVCVVLIVIPNVVLAIWALRNPNEMESNHA